MKLENLPVDFTDEQKRYFEGFAAGVQIIRRGRGLGGDANAGKGNAEPVGPDAAHIKAQDKVTEAGKKLADQEKFKREEHPFDAYPRLKQQALDNAPPVPADNFRWRYFGLFYVAPAQSSYMCRLRLPNGMLKHWQLAGLADLGLEGPAEQQAQGREAPGAQRDDRRAQRERRQSGSPAECKTDGTQDDCLQKHHGDHRQ